MLPLLILALTSLAPLQEAPESADELWAAGRRVEALERMESDLARRPADRSLRLALARREVLVQRYRAALTHLEPLGTEADRLRGRALYFVGEYDRALALLDPGRADEVLLRVAALEALGRMEACDREIDAAVAALGAGDARVRLHLAQRLVRRGELEEAIALFRGLLAEDPVNSAALFGLGRALVASGRREEGLEVLARHRALLPLLDEHDFVLRGLDLAPLHAPNHAALGDVERRLGRGDRAEAAYARALELATSEQVVPIALRYARLLHEDRHRTLAAARILDAVQERTPDVRLLVRAGDLYRAAGEVALARARYRSGLELRPGDRAIRARLDGLGAGDAGGGGAR